MAIPALHQPALEILQNPAWQLYDWLIHGFTTRTGGHSTAYSPTGELNLGYTVADDPEAVRRNRELLVAALMADRPAAAGASTLVTTRQVHAADIHVVQPSSSASPLTGDGLLTSDAGVLLGILTADCVPVLIVDTRLRSVGALHAGWRGTVQRIAEKGVAQMVADFNSRPCDLQALIGPAIGACCYTVGAEVQESFHAEFRYAADLMTSPGPALSGCRNTAQLDLREANCRQLQAAGVPTAAIHKVGGCTSCEPERYFSHRQSGGNTGRMMSVIGIRPSDPKGLQE